MNNGTIALLRIAVVALIAATIVFAVRPVREHFDNMTVTQARAMLTAAKKPVPKQDEQVLKDAAAHLTAIVSAGKSQKKAAAPKAAKPKAPAKATAKAKAPAPKPKAPAAKPKATATKPKAPAPAKAKAPVPKPKATTPKAPAKAPAPKPKAPAPKSKAQVPKSKPPVPKPVMAKTSAATIAECKRLLNIP